MWRYSVAVQLIHLAVASPRHWWRTSQWRIEFSGSAVGMPRLTSSVSCELSGVVLRGLVIIIQVVADGRDLAIHRQCPLGLKNQLSNLTDPLGREPLDQD
jgi:hypothetical protein